MLFPVQTNTKTILRVGGISGLAAFILVWIFAIAPWITRLPKNYSFSADIFSTDNFYDPALGDYVGEVLSNSKFSYEVIASKNNNLLLDIKNSMDVRKLNGEKIFSVDRIYGIDAITRQHVTGYGDRDRTGYLFAPPNLRKQDFVYWHVNYDMPINMKFVAEEQILGLKVYKYEANFTADQTKELSNLPDVGKTKGINLDVHLVEWVEPETGSMVKYQDEATAYYYDLITHDRIQPWNKFSNRFTDRSVAAQVAELRTQVAIQFVVLRIMPAIFTALVLFFLFVFLARHFNKLSEFFRLLPFLLFLFGLSITYWTYQNNISSQLTTAETAFETYSNTLATAIGQRINSYLEAQNGFEGLFATSEFVDQDTFDIFYDSLKLADNYPGFRAVSYVTRVDDKDLNAFVAARKSDDTLIKGGNPTFEVKQQTNLPTHYILTYVAKNPANPIIGTDLGFDKDRLDSYNKATAQLQTISSVPVILPASNVSPKALGFFITRPMFLKDKAKKPENISGFLNTVIEYNTFFDTVFQAYPVRRNTTVTVSDLTTKAELYKSARSDSIYFTKTVPIKFGNRTWEMKIEASKDFSLSAAQLEVPNVILGGGTTLSAVIAIMLFFVQWRYDHHDHREHTPKSKTEK